MGRQFRLELLDRALEDVEDIVDLALRGDHRRAQRQRIADGPGYQSVILQDGKQLRPEHAGRKAFSGRKLQRTDQAGATGFDCQWVFGQALEARKEVAAEIADVADQIALLDDRQVFQRHRRSDG